MKIWKLFGIFHLFLYFCSHIDGFVVEKRLEYVDIAKGFGILLVVCSHSDALDFMWLMMGMFVPIFYFCSGFTYVKKGSFMETTNKRFIRLFVPYLFFNFLMLLIFQHFSLRELVGIVYSRYCLYPLDYTPNVKFLTSGNYPMWFLTSMIVTYYLFCLIIYCERYKNLFIMVYAGMIVVLMYCPILLPWSLDTAPLTALIMYAGMETRRRGLMKMNVWLVLCLSFFYIGLAFFGGDINISVKMYGNSIVVYFVLAIIGSFVVLWGSQLLERTLVGRFFSILGKHSLTIFCIEMVFIVWAKDIFLLLFPRYGVNYLTGLFEIIVSLLGGILVSIFLHKSRLLSRIAYAS